MFYATKLEKVVHKLYICDAKMMTIKKNANKLNKKYHGQESFTHDPRRMGRGQTG